MSVNGFIFREASGADMPGISHVRASVTENVATREQLERQGITDAGVAASFLADSKGWVAERGGHVVAFSIADRASRSIFALFVLPAYEGRGLGGRLLALALQWLWANGAAVAWLATGPGTRAVRFYERRGWTCTGREPNGDLRFELRRPRQNPI